MQRVTPAKAFPTVASIEEVLYQNATTDLEYAKPGNLGLRITRAISDIERRTGQVHGKTLIISHRDPWKPYQMQGCEEERIL